MDEEDQSEPDYLKKELLERIASHSPTQMRLEMMSIEQEEKNLDLLIPGTYWGRTWQGLGCITLCDVDMQEQSPESRIRFRSDNLPAGLSIIESSGHAEPNWWMETKAKVDDRGGICPSRQSWRGCKIFASGVNFSIFTHFLCFFLLKLLKLGEIDGVKFLA